MYNAIGSASVQGPVPSPVPCLGATLWCLVRTFFASVRFSGSSLGVAVGGTAYRSVLGVGGARACLCWLGLWFAAGIVLSRLHAGGPEEDRGAPLLPPTHTPLLYSLLAHGWPLSAHFPWSIAREGGPPEHQSCPSAGALLGGCPRMPWRLLGSGLVLHDARSKLRGE